MIRGNKSNPYNIQPGNSVYSWCKRQKNPVIIFGLLLDFVNLKIWYWLEHIKSIRKQQKYRYTLLGILHKV